MVDVRKTEISTLGMGYAGVNYVDKVVYSQEIQSTCNASKKKVCYNIT
jgi:hypothetical protein